VAERVMRDIRGSEMDPRLRRNQTADDQLTAECRAGPLSQISPNLQQTFLPSASSLLWAAAAAASSARQFQ